MVYQLFSTSHFRHAIIFLGNRTLVHQITHLQESPARHHFLERRSREKDGRQRERERERGADALFPCYHPLRHSCFRAYVTSQPWRTHSGCSENRAPPLVQSYDFAASTLELAHFPKLIILSLVIVLASVIFYFYSATSANHSKKKKTTTLDQARAKPSNRQSSQKSVQQQQQPQQQQHTKVSWLKTTLKGHKGQVLDFHFSNNSKYLASCANALRTDRSTRKRGSNSRGNHKQPMTLLTNIYHTLTTMLDNVDTSPGRKMDHRSRTPPLRLNNSQLYALMSQYVMTPSQLQAHGYPLEVAGRPGKAMVTSYGYNRGPSFGTGASSDGEDSGDESSDDQERLCCRCNTLFSSSQQLRKCEHHWGKLVDSPYNASSWYTCCNSPKGAPGCTRGAAHVTLGKTSGMMDKFVRTTPAPFKPLDGNYGLYGIDCEMCFTTHGLELAKLTVVLPDGRVCYETHVRPSHPVVDYNTRFSGLTAEDLEDVTCTLEDVQRHLLHLFNAETILVGHGLENDLRALRMVHGRVVDTAALFPHYLGLPYRRSLRSLAGAYLKKNIQVSGRGHDSREDAHSSLELALWQMQKDLLDMRF